jgi:hypothetical protein
MSFSLKSFDAFDFEVGRGRINQAITVSIASTTLYSHAARS